jgi:hypothetical protein
MLGGRQGPGRGQRKGSTASGIGTVADPGARYAMRPQALAPILADHSAASMLVRSSVE